MKNHTTNQLQYPKLSSCIQSLSSKPFPFPDHSVGETVRPNTDDPELQPYHPWGRGGAGAPVFDSTGNPIPNIYGRIQNEVMASELSSTVTEHTYESVTIFTGMRP